nr:hypothetical protein [Tanacetum cinerariifolium]
FRDTLIQHLESVKKSIDERVQLKREYDSWVNERQMQTIEEKVDTSKALDASSVDTESSRTESKEQDTSSRSGNDAHDDDVDIRPIYDEEPMAEESDKIEKYIGGLPDMIHGSVVASKPKTMQEAIEIATELMDNVEQNRA